ncbi:MAG: DUF3365 domain-containing protein [Gammaproteobacteria bacterium]|nr:DUF3365 domain-containing protein [Gammaproteobacteria bacterium]
MKLLTIACSLVMMLFFQNVIAKEHSHFDEQAQKAIKEFAIALKAALGEAMEKGGPIEAIPVCSKVAPTIAKELSDKYGMTIGRTSLKVRNPANKPDSWEEAVLQQFEQRKAQGESVTSLVYSGQRVDDHQDEQWRMMKAIPTAKLCLPCHGSNIDAPVQTVLDKLYPDDKATGFSLGDIRGAFSVHKIKTR